MDWEAIGVIQTEDEGGLSNGLAVRLGLRCILDLEFTGSKTCRWIRCRYVSYMRYVDI